MATIVFDLDGTLADTSGDLLRAANAVFQHWGHGDVLDPGLQGDRSTAMKGGRAMLRRGLDRLHGTIDEAQVDAGYPVLLEAYAQSLSVETRLFEGAEEVIRSLRGDGHVTAVCTNKPEGLAEALLQDLNVRDLFGSLVGADTLSVRKPDPAPLREAVARAGGDLARTVLIGDTITDRETARAAGVASILVTFGPDGPAVADLEPEALLDHYRDLPDRLRDLALI